MPPTPRRRLTRRIAPPRPTYEGAPVAEEDVSHRVTAETRRVNENVLRQAPYLVAELKRIAGITGVCFAMLAALAIIDRMR